MEERLRALVAVLLALADRVLVVLVVGDEAAAGTGACADEGAFAAAEQAPDDGAAGRRAADDLGFGVMAGVMVVLLPFCAPVRLLAEALHGREGESGEENQAGALNDLHTLPFFLGPEPRPVDTGERGVRGVQAM